MEEINPPLGDGQPPVPPKDAPVCMDTGDPGVKGEEETRLMISKIVCENFKSYAGIKEIGPFHKVRISGKLITWSLTFTYYLGPSPALHQQNTSYCKCVDRSTTEE